MILRHLLEVFAAPTVDGITMILLGSYIDDDRGLYSILFGPERGMRL